MHKSIHKSECQKKHVQTTHVSKHKEEGAHASHHHHLLATYQGMIQAVPQRAVKDQNQEYNHISRNEFK